MSNEKSPMTPTPVIATLKDEIYSLALLDGTPIERDANDPYSFCIMQDVIGYCYEHNLLITKFIDNENI